MGSYVLKEYHATEPLGLWDVTACDTESKGASACTTLPNQYKVSGAGKHGGFIGDSSGTFYFLPQRLATDKAFMKEHMSSHQQACLSINPCDEFVSLFCCQPGSENKKDKNLGHAENESDSDRALKILAIVLMVLVTVFVLVLAGVAYYVGHTGLYG